VIGRGYDLLATLPASLNNIIRVVLKGNPYPIIPTNPTYKDLPRPSYIFPQGIHNHVPRRMATSLRLRGNRVEGVLSRSLALSLKLYRDFITARLKKVH
jgi:hypothetical protein